MEQPQEAADEVHERVWERVAAIDVASARSASPSRWYSCLVVASRSMSASRRIEVFPTSLAPMMTAWPRISTSRSAIRLWLAILIRLISTTPLGVRRY